MKDVCMKPNGKLLQIFLSPKDSPAPGISEVYLGSKEKLHCTCPGYRGKSSCKHTQLVKKRLEEHDGAYPLTLAKGTLPEELAKAEASPEEFRNFVLSYGKIEVY